MHDLRPSAPLRPPDWRWQAAQKQQQEPERGRALLQDAATVQAASFLSAMNRCRDDWDLLELCQRWPDLFNAQDLYRRPDCDVRHELEARILAGLNHDQLSQKLPLTVPTIVCYEQLFFDVRDRLACRSWVCHQVLGRALHLGIVDRQYDLLWKLIGYSFGSDVLDLVIYQTSGGQAPADPDRRRAYLHDQMQQLLERRDLITVLTFKPPDAYTKMQYLEFRARYEEMEQRARTGSSGSALTANLIEVFRSLEPLAVGTAEAKQLATIYDGLAAEPRANELLAQRLGLPAPKRAELEDVSFPAPEPEAKTDSDKERP